MPTNRPRTARKTTASSGGDATPLKNANVPPPPPPINPMTAEREAADGIERIGDILRRRRQQRGDDLQHISDYLCIRRSFLTALENSDYAELPADAYAIGFLRSYATYLGFDGIEAINRYRNEMAGRRRKPQLAMPTPITEGRSPSPLIMVGAAVLAIAVYAAWYGFSAAGRTIVNKTPLLPTVAATATMSGESENPVIASAAVPALPAVSDGIKLPAPADTAVVTAPSAPAHTTLLEEIAKPAKPALAEKQKEKEKKKEAEKSSDEPVATPAATSIPTTTNITNANTAPADDAAATAGPSRLTLRAEKETWVHVADAKDNTIFDKVMKPGDTYAVPDTEGLKLTTGNSSGIILVLDGKDMPKLARSSSILHDIPLDINKLKNPKSKPPKAAAKPQE